MSQKEFSALEADISSNPEGGAVIVGTHGLRKIRVRREGGGKSGGFRIIYFWVVSRDTILLLDVYSKSDQANLTESEKKKLGGLRDEYLENWK